MTFTTHPNSPATVDLTPNVEAAIATCQRLPVDDQLGLIWRIYNNLGCSLMPIPPGAARLFLTQGLLHRIQQMPATEQLMIIHNLVHSTDTPISRQYALFLPHTKVAFWYQLFEWMSRGEVAPQAASYQLSPQAAALFKVIASLELDDQSTFVRLLVTDMGYSPS